MRSSSKKRGDAGVARHELIGLDVTVESPHAGWNGLSGRIVDETMHTIVVETTSGSVKRVPKPGQWFLFRVGNVRIAGDAINFRPEDRTKKSR